MIGRGAAALLLAGATGCCACVFGPTFTVRHGAALDPPPAPGLSPPALRVLHFGDFGADTCQQEVVAAGMAASHRRAPFDLAFAAGDLIYPCGPSPAVPGADRCAFAADANTAAPGSVAPDDPAYALHEAPLGFLSGVPVYVALGNHDVTVGGSCGAPGEATERLKACLNVAHVSPSWILPGRHYTVDLGPARFIVFDSNLVTRDYGAFSLDDEVAFVASQAAECAGRFCFLVGHHPPATAGVHRDDATPEYLARMQRVLDAGGPRIRAFLAGHDHDLQHLRTPAGLEVLVSGSGALSRWRETFDAASAGAVIHFASMRWGHGVLEVSTDGWRYRFEGDDGAVLYCCVAVGAGPCEPASCT